MSNILSASRLLAIDGCDRNVALETQSKAGFPVNAHLCLADIGLEKGTTPATIEVIEQAAG